MRKILLIIAFITCPILLTQAQRGFRINGVIEGYKNGTVYLVNSANTKDTLSKSKITEGRFELTGKVDKPLTAYIRVHNVANSSAIFLENTFFTARLKITDTYGVKADGQTAPVKELENEFLSSIRGGKDQKIANQYWKLFARNISQYNKIRTQYQEAENKNDTETLKRLEAKDKMIREEVIINAKKLLSKYKNNYVSAYMIRENLCDLYNDEDEAQELYKLLIPALWPQQQNSSKKNDICPNFTLSDFKGSPVSLYNIKSKVKILEFWSLGCAPCLQEMPKLLKLYQKYRSKGVEVIAITLGTDLETAEKFQKKLGTTWINLGQFKGSDTNIQELFNINSIPYKIILDENNRIICKGTFTLYTIQTIIESLVE